MAAFPQPTQALPSWLTLVSTVVTDATGGISTSFTTVQLPLTYYGPPVSDQTVLIPVNVSLFVIYLVDAWGGSTSFALLGSEYMRSASCRRCADHTVVCDAMHSPASSLAFRLLLQDLSPWASVPNMHIRAWRKTDKYSVPDAAGREKFLPHL